MTLPKTPSERQRPRHFASPATSGDSSDREPPHDSVDVVRLPDELVDAIVRQAVAGLPHESCGLLVGQGGDVKRVVPTGNADASATRYTIPPAEHFAAIRAARGDGLDVIGAYHSHPRGDATPSDVDRQEGADDFIYVIAGLVPTTTVRAWRLVRGNFAELRLVRT